MNKRLLHFTLSLTCALSWLLLSTSCSGTDELSNVAESGKLLTLNDSLKYASGIMNQHDSVNYNYKKRMCYDFK